MPVYNGEKYLKEAIESILSQTYKNFEFLIIDDGSTDASEKIIRKFSDDRIRVLKNTRRLKLSGALNRGLDNANGEFVARMDADDIALPDRLDIQMKYLHQRPELGICGSWIQKFGNQDSDICEFPKTYEQVRSYALFDCPFAHPTVMIRKSFFDSHGLRYNGAYYPTEDYELWNRALDYFAGENIEKVLLKYRVHNKSMTLDDWDEMDCKAKSIVEGQLKKLGLDCSDETIKTHRNIGRGISHRSKNIEELKAGELWLRELLSANRNKKRYNPETLAETVALVWFRFCMNSTGLGFGVLSNYSKSSLTKSDALKKRRLMNVALSVLKQRYLL